MESELLDGLSTRAISLRTHSQDEASDTISDVIDLWWLVEVHQVEVIPTTRPKCQRSPVDVVRGVISTERVDRLDRPRSLPAGLIDLHVPAGL